jgi:putative CocE/NonD family hydrolase
MLAKEKLMRIKGVQTLDNFPWRVGVPRASTSGMEKWEAPDPAEWCQRGYIIVNVDARGAFNSEGDIHVYGTQVSRFETLNSTITQMCIQEGRDGHDTIEWIGTQNWCNGSVALVGNSWLGTTQW